MQNMIQFTNEKLNSKAFIIAAFILCWSLLLWINFFATMSIAMHYIAMPTLFLLTGGYAAYQLEERCYDSQFTEPKF